MQSLARMITPRQKANPAGEGNYHPGPYTVSRRCIPAGCADVNYWQCDIDPVSGVVQLDRRGLRLGLCPRHRAIAGLSQARTGQWRHRGRHHLGAVALVAVAESVPDAVRFPGASDPLVAVQRQFVLDCAAQRSRGGRPRCTGPIRAPAGCAKSGAGPAVHRNVLRDRRQSAVPVRQHPGPQIRWWCRRATCCTSNWRRRSIR